MLGKNITTLDRYFRYPYKPAPFGQRPDDRLPIIDISASATHLPFANESVDKILCVNFVNHVIKQEFGPMIQQWHRVLKPNGLLIIDVDHIGGMSQNLVEAMKIKDEEERISAINLCCRYIYCHSRTPGDSHYWGFTPETLIKDVVPYGFKFEWRNDDYIHHDAGYPQFIIGFSKV